MSCPMDKSQRLIGTHALTHRWAAEHLLQPPSWSQAHPPSFWFFLLAYDAPLVCEREECVTSVCFWVQRARTVLFTLLRMPLLQIGCQCGFPSSLLGFGTLLVFDSHFLFSLRHLCGCQQVPHSCWGGEGLGLGLLLGMRLLLGVGLGLAKASGSGIGFWD